MKYFLFSFMGESLPIALRLQQEGHEVIVGFVNSMSDVLSDAEDRGKKRTYSLEKTTTVSF